MIWRIKILGTCLAILAAPAMAGKIPSPATTRTGAPVNSVSWGEPYSRVKEHADSIYLVKIDKIMPNPPANSMIQGKVTLQVVSTLRGPKADVITVPYYYADPKAAQRRPTINVWPEIESAPPALLLVCVSTGKDSSEVARNPKIADEAMVANIVRPVNREDDPVVKDYQTIAALADIPQEKLIEKLLDAAKDNPGTSLCQYLFRAGVNLDMQPHHTDGLLLICAMVESYSAKDMAFSTAFQSLAYLESRFSRAESSDEEKTLILKTLVNAIVSKNTDKSTLAISSLARLVSTKASVQLLSDADAKLLAAFVEGMDSRGAAGDSILTWLKKKT